MHCVSCAMNIDGALEDLKGVKKSRTSYAKSQVEVEYDENIVNKEQLIKTIKIAGYEAFGP